MTIHEDGTLSPEEIAMLADRITGLRTGTTMSGPYESGYRHGLSDAAAEVITLYRRVNALAYAAEVAAAENTAALIAADEADTGLDELADVAKSLLGLAVRLDLADETDVNRRLSALGGDQK